MRHVAIFAFSAFLAASLSLSKSASAQENVPAIAPEEKPAAGESPKVMESAPEAKAEAKAEAEAPREFEEVPDYVTSEQLFLHTIQRKEFSDGGRHEFVLYPGIAQINTKFTTHLGVGGQYAYHVHENFAFQVMGEYFYVNGQTAFTDELVNNGKQAPQAATALTLMWAASGGFEVTPIYGKFAFYEGTIGHFGIVLSGGAGMAQTRIQIQSESSAAGQSTFGDTGMKFVGQVGAGFRLYLSEHLLLRVEIKDLVYTAKVDSINGCDAIDLGLLKSKRVPEGGTCRAEDFAESDIPIAERLVEEPSSDVLNNIGAYAGFAYAF